MVELFGKEFEKFIKTFNKLNEKEMNILGLITSIPLCSEQEIYRLSKTLFNITRKDTKKVLKSLAKKEAIIPSTIGKLESRLSMGNN